MRKWEPNLPSSSLGCNKDPPNFRSHFPNNWLRRAMIPSSTIDFNVVKARKNNGRSAVWYHSGKSFVLIHLSRQIELDEPREVMLRTHSLLQSGSPWAPLYWPYLGPWMELEDDCSIHLIVGCLALLLVIRVWRCDEHVLRASCDNGGGWCFRTLPCLWGHFLHFFSSNLLPQTTLNCCPHTFRCICVSSLTPPPPPTPSFVWWLHL
jgi:hypothetical protein